MATVSLQGAKMGYDTLSGEKKTTGALRGQMDCSLRKTQQIFFKNAEKVHETQQKLNKTQ